MAYLNDTERRYALHLLTWLAKPQWVEGTIYSMPNLTVSDFAKARQDDSVKKYGSTLSTFVHWLIANHHLRLMVAETLGQQVGRIRVWFPCREYAAEGNEWEDSRELAAAKSVIWFYEQE